MAIGDLAVIKIHSNTYADNNEVAFGFVSISGVTAWRQILVDGFATLVLPAYFAGLTEQSSLDELVIQDVVPGTGLELHPTSGEEGSGTIDDDPMPPQIAGKLLWKSATAGRSGKGCNFIPGLPMTSGFLQTQIWGTAAQAYLANLKDVLLTAYGESGTSTFGRLCIISRWVDHEERPVPVGFPVVSGDYETAIRSCRRRQKQ